MNIKIINILIIICFVLIFGLTFNVLSSCSSSQELMSDSRRPTPGDTDWPEYDWMHRHPWAETFNKVGDDEDYNFENYNPAAAVFFDRNKETGLCFAFYGRSFIQVPSWACNKK